jgi:hypothetical protein
MVRKLAIALFAVTLVAAACGSDDTDDGAPQTDDDTSGIAATCAIGVPDCNDTVVLGEDEPPVADSDSEPVTSTGVLVNGGLTVDEALATDATRTLAVQGFLVADGTDIRLCSALAESFPPQCGGTSIVLDAASVDELVYDDETPFSSDQGVTWTDVTITLLGEIVDGRLAIDTLSLG